MTKYNCNEEGYIITENCAYFCDCKIEKIKAQIGQMFKDCTIEGLILRGNQKDAIKVKENPAGSYFLVGKFKQGKTHILACQFDWLLKKYRLPVVKFFREIDLITDWQNWENGRFYTVDDFKTQNIQHIIIDDIARSKITERVEQEMYGLIDWIYTNNIGLSISSNFDYNELVNKYGGAIVRRIEDICQKIII